MKFSVIASGSAGNCYLVTEGESRLMVEVGVRKKVLLDKGIKSSTLDGCLVTHSHADHSGGIRSLIKSGVNCYTSRGTADELGISGSHRVFGIKALKRLNIGPWKVLPFDTVHDTAEPLGFLIQAPSGDKLLFATDTAYIKYTFVGLTHIAVEANYSDDMVREAVKSGGSNPVMARRLYGSHMSLQGLKRMLGANDLSKVREIHLLHLSDRHSDEKRFRNEIEKQTGIATYVAESL